MTNGIKMNETRHFFQMLIINFIQRTENNLKVFDNLLCYL